MQNDEHPPMAFNATDVDTSNYPLVHLSPRETELYKWIDYIDTLGKLTQENPEAFRNLAMKRIKEFHEKNLVFSDGYDVWKSHRLVEGKR